MRVYILPAAYCYWLQGLQDEICGGGELAGKLMLAKKWRTNKRLLPKLNSVVSKAGISDIHIEEHTGKPRNKRVRIEYSHIQPEYYGPDKYTLAPNERRGSKNSYVGTKNGKSVHVRPVTVVNFKQKGNPRNPLNFGNFKEVHSKGYVFGREKRKDNKKI